LGGKNENSLTILTDGAFVDSTSLSTRVRSETLLCSSYRVEEEALQQVQLSGSRDSNFSTDKENELRSFQSGCEHYLERALDDEPAVVAVPNVTNISFSFAKASLIAHAIAK